MILNSIKGLLYSLLTLRVIAHVVEESVDLEKRAIAAWPTRILAPYLYLVKWPKFDVNDCIWNTGQKLYTLAFITGDDNGNPAWGGYDPLTDSFYSDYVNNIRNQGGDVIISFGGAAGHELALLAKDANDLANKYQQVIDRYKLTYIDVDIEGGAITNPNSIERRSQALKIVRQKNPGITISYTLPVTPNGLDNNGLYCIKSAVWNGLTLDVINIMTMDYGNVPNGATGMGGYAISAAEGTYKQIVAEGMKNTKIGITPMIGRNDVWAEVFRLENARQLNDWAKTKDWVRLLSFWSINRDTDKWNDLWLSSQITQNKYDFVKTMKNWADSGSPIVPAAVPVSVSNTGGTPSHLFAPYVDILAWPTFDVNVAMRATGVRWYSLGFIIADKDGDPSWGGFYKWRDSFYMDQINRLRAAGGDVIISFGGAAGTELAMHHRTVAATQQRYQQVIDLYKPKWVDFDVEGPAITDFPNIDIRTQALLGLQRANPGLKISYTLPTTPNGLATEGLYILQSAKKFGFNFDVLNLMTMVYGLPPNNMMGRYAMSAASGAFNQLVSVGIEGCKIGITPMIGENDDGTTFSLANAQEVTNYAREQRSWISFVSHWSMNRDNGAKKGLWASSQITQNDWDFSNIMKNWMETTATNPPVVIPPVSSPSPTSSRAPAAPAPTGIPTRVFAPYCDILLWPTFDVADAAAASGARWFTLAFVTANGAGNPAWGSSIAVTDRFYSSQITKLRALGGDVIISFGGAIGQELAVVTTDVAALQRKYQSVIDIYNVRWLDFDVEGGALPNTAANTRRAQAIRGLHAANANLKTSITLPVSPSGLTDDGINIIRNAVQNGWKIDMVNIMAMDYGGLSDGATGMGRYAISAAEATYRQAQDAGLTNFQIGITPMIGKNDVAGEVFTLSNAQEVLNFALRTNWVGQIAYWSINRDTNVDGPLYASSQIAQERFAFANIFKGFHGSIGSSPAPSPTAPVVQPPAPSPTNARVLSLTNKIVAPYCDILLWPTFDVSRTLSSVGTPWFALAFVVADSAGNPSWGGITPTSSRFYINELTKLRGLGGDAMVSFGGATGQELAVVTSDAAGVQRKYQNVIDTYQFKWADFDVEGPALLDMAGNTRRAQALAGLKRANPNLIISVTLPVMPNGLTTDGVNFIRNLVQNGAQVDVFNIMTMSFGNGQGKMGEFSISAARATYQQITAAGLNARIGITPMIGKNDVQTEIFTLDNAREVVNFARATPWVASLHYWSINRDTSTFGPLYASSQITQTDYAFARIFNEFISSSSPPPAPSPVATSASARPPAITARPVPVQPDPNFIGGYRWGRRVFAPYVVTTQANKFDVVDMSNSVGSSRYVLGHITSGPNGRPAWASTILLSKMHYLDQIRAIRFFGGDAIISFGGNDGRELAFTSNTPIILRNHYQNVIDAYSVNWIDFQLNDTSIADRAVVDRRNQALRDMQLANPNIRVSYSLPLTPTGLTVNGRYVLESCMNFGVRVDVVNLMAMNYGKTAAPNAGTNSVSYAIEGATAVYSHVQSIGMSAKIGITPMIGQNDIPSEFFQTADATQLVTWAKSRAWVGFLSYWSANRDNSNLSTNLDISSGITQVRWAFARIFVQYEN